MAETQIAAPAAPDTPAVVEIEQPASIADLTPTERDTWRLSGEWPERKPEAAEKVEPAPEPKAAEPPKAPEAPKQPEKPAEPVSRRQQYINDLVRQRVEAEQRAQQLAAQLEQARRAPEAQGQPPPGFDPGDVEPTPDQFENYEQFVDSRARWVARQERRAWESETRQRAAQEARHQALANFGQRCAEYEDANPDKGFADKAKPLLDRLTLGTPIGDAVALSPVGPQLALHLAEHPEEEARIVRLHPMQQVYELGKLEGRIEQETVKASTSASAVPAQAKVVTEAPAPPHTLEPRPSAPADDVEDAIAAGDFRRFRAVANQREIGKAR